jgi:hypothetical protein
VRLSTTSATFTTGNQVGMRTSLSFTAGTVDVTVRWKGIQLESGSSASAWQQSLGRYEAYEANTYSIAGLTADGIDDALYSEANISLTSASTIAVVTNAIKTSDDSTGVLVEFSSNVRTNSGSFAIIGSDSGNYWTSYLSGSTLGASNQTSTAYSAGTPVVLDGGYVITTNTNNFRANVTTLATSATDLGTGGFGNYPLYVFSRANTVLPFGGFCTGVFVRNTLSNRNGPAYQFARDIGIE